MSEQKELYEKCKSLGIDVHHRSGVDKLKSALFDHYAKMDAVQEAAPKVEEAVEEAVQDTEPAQTNEGKYTVLTRADIDRLDGKEKKDKRNLSRLRRIRLTCMNPAKSEWPGEIVSVGSRKMGTFKKFIPFNGEPYHVPQVIYDMLKERKCSQFYNTTDARGQKVRRSRLINEFAIEDLPPLTEKELTELRRKQAMAANGL